MLKVKLLVNGKVVTDTIGEDKTQNYVLEYNTDDYIDDYGDEQYKYIQYSFNVDTQLDILCRYMYANNLDCYGSEYFVVFTCGQYLLLNWDTQEVQVMDTHNINSIHKYVLELMEQN